MRRSSASIATNPKMQRLPKGRREGFSLIEMLVILGIVAVLAAILFPVVANGKSSGKGGDELNKMRVLAQASGMYAADFNDTFVSVGVPAQNFSWSPAVNPQVDAAGNPWMGWGLRIAPYEPNYQSFVVPPQPAAYTFTGLCSTSGAMKLTNDFSVNWMLGGDGTYGNFDDPTDSYAWSPDGSYEFNLPAALGKIADPASTIAFTPGNARAPINSNTGCLISTLEASDFSNQIAPYTFDHNDRAAIALADGHAALVTDPRMSAGYQGQSGPWRVFHLQSKSLWMEPTMPDSSMGFVNRDASDNNLGDL